MNEQHKNRVLIVEDDVAFGIMLHSFLERNNFDVSVVLTGAEAREKLKGQKYDLFISDLKLPDDSGLELLEFSKENSPQTEVILMTGYADVVTAVESIKKGALDYISKPFRPEELLMVIQQMAEPDSSTTSHITPDKNVVGVEIPEKKGMVNGISEASKKFNEYIKLVGPTDMCVLIQGESGTGKEVAAKAIHNSSHRKGQNFIPVDCGAIPREIASSEFFGHVKGSFTGAITDKKGHFEAAQGGTLFLDEVGNLSYENQIQLLRALQERKIKPVGSNKEINVDVRILSATNEDLKKAVEEGRFREDLYHRLNEFSLHIPALRERREDLFIFTEYFLGQANASLSKNVMGFHKEVEEAFQKYSWPGNLRELKNVIKRAVLLAPSQIITLEVIPREVLYTNNENVTRDFNKETHEKQLILNTLKETDNNKSKAAKLLGITRKTLYNKIEQFKIEL